VRLQSSEDWVWVVILVLVANFGLLLRCIKYTKMAHLVAGEYKRLGLGGVEGHGVDSLGRDFDSYGLKDCQSMVTRKLL
jgi:hypothetical protein